MNIDELYTKYFNDVYRFVFSLTKNKSITEDIVQETFTRAYLNLDSFKNTPSKAWLFTVSRNLFYDHLRKAGRIFDFEYDFTKIPDSVKSTEEKLFKKETIQQVRGEIMNLRENYREAILCFYVKELTYKEAAKEMNVTEANFKSILFRAKRHLKRALERKGESFDE